MKLMLIDEKKDVISDETLMRRVYQIGHYSVMQYATIFEDGSMDESIFIGVDNTENYIPEIRYNGRLKNGKRSFSIQTTAYGALTPEAIEKVVSGYTEAIHVVEILTENLDVSVFRFPEEMQ